MLQKCEQPQSPNEPQQLKIGELLSKLISQFSQLMQATFRLVLLAEEPEPLPQNDFFLSFLHKLGMSLFNIHAHPTPKRKIMEDPFLTANTCRRFSCRLVENLLHFKSRAETSNSFGPIALLIVNCQRAISSFQQNCNILQLLEQIYGSFLTITNDITQKFSRPEKKSENKKTEGESPPSKKGITSRDLRSKSFQIEPQYQRKLRKLVANINTRFKTLDCMDLDYGHFRSSFFQAKSTDFFDECMERNHTIDTQIKDYGRAYQQYLKKKDKRRTQRALQLSSTNDKFALVRNYNEEKEGTVYANRRVSLKVNNWAQERERTNRLELSSKKYSLAEQCTTTGQLAEKEPNKIKYELKNVMITASRINLEPCMEVHKMNMKGTLRQLEVSRRKYSKLEDKPFLKNLRQLSQKYDTNRK